MSHFRKPGMWAILFVLTFVFTSAAYAEEGNTERSLTGFFRRLFNYPVKAAQKTGEMTGNTLNNTGEKVLSQTGEKLSQGEFPQAIVQPVIGTAETTGQAVAETVQIPVEAAQEDAPAQQ